MIADADGQDPNELAPGSDAGSAPDAPLPKLDARIALAREAAERRRRELGLPELAAEERELPAIQRRAPRKRTKDHRGWGGQGSRR